MRRLATGAATCDIAIGGSNERLAKAKSTHG